MEKRGLLLVVMLLATSGVVLAGKSDDETTTTTTKSTTTTTKRTRKERLRDAKLKVRKALSVVVHPSRWFHNPRTSVAVSFEVAKEELGDGNYLMAACDMATLPFYAAWKTTLGDFCPCLNKYYFVESFRFGTGVAIGVTATVAYEAWKKRHEASKGLKKLFKNLRSFGASSKTPEKKTDASTIEA